MAEILRPGPVTGLHVVVRHRSANPGVGLLVLPLCPGYGGGLTTYRFETSLDAAAPSVLPLDPGTGRVIPGKTRFPLTLSPTDVDVVLVTFDDAHCACTFDLDPTWTIRGKTGHTLALAPMPSLAG
ncbi:hypothetical protein [Streptacidiphilus sp. EB103A]|jgi:hypothetical protein|uniref:hypothetical protein n=1 Tax=Streptacidiphilus sp. EB103A TaxID=3156275 RepID=UPI003517B943